jgi:hypothetical protein
VKSNHPLLDHGACTYRSKANAHTALATCLGLDRLYEFTLDKEPASQLLGLERPVEVVVFGSGGRLIEAFVVPERTIGTSPNHLCLILPDLPLSLERCKHHGLDVRTAWLGDHDVYFVRDMDGNLFELKHAT